MGHKKNIWKVSLQRGPSLERSRDRFPYQELTFAIPQGLVPYLFWNCASREVISEALEFSSFILGRPQN